LTSDAAVDPSSAPRRSRWKRAAVLTILAFGLLACVFAYRNYTDPIRVRFLAEQYLSRFVTGRVTVSAAQFSFVEGVRLFDVTIEDVPIRKPAPSDRADENSPTDSIHGKPSSAIPAFWCRELELKHDPLAALVGTLRIESILALEPTCTVIHDSATGQTNLRRLFRPFHRRTAGDPDELPTIELRDARIRVLARGPEGDREVEDLRLTLRALQSQQDRRLYDIVWRGRDTESPGGHSQLELATGLIRNVRGGLPSMSIEAVLLAVNARFDGVGVWSNVLGLDGRVQAKDYNLLDRSDIRESRSATIELTRATLSIPISSDEHALDREERYLNFDDVKGTVTVTTDNLLAAFTGRFHGSECAVTAKLRSNMAMLRSLDDVDFDVHMVVKGLKIPRPDDPAAPEEARFINRFERLRRTYRDFDAHGRVDIEVEARKQAGIDQPVELKRATIVAQDAQVTCRVFPYRGDRVTGRIDITPDGISIQNVRGEHSGASIMLEGWLAQPNACAEGSFFIRGSDVPIDEALFAALRPSHQAIARRFGPTGRVDLEVILQRPACESATPSNWSSQVTVDLDHTGASFDAFPYPLEHLTGEVVIAGDHAEIHDVRGRPVSASDSPAPASVSINGQVIYDGGGMTGIDIRVDGRDLPIDDRLLRALPDRMHERVAPFEPKGTFDVKSALSFDPRSRSVVHRTNISLRDAAIRHRDLALPIQDVAGTMTVEPGRVEIHAITGRYHDGRITAQGSLDETQSSLQADLVIAGAGVVCDDECVSALPEKWRSAIGDWRVRTPIDGSLSIKKTVDSADAPPKMEAILRLANGLVIHPLVPIPLTNVNGELLVDARGFRCTKLRGRFGDADISASFDIGPQAVGSEGVIRLDARGLRLDRNVRALLPERLRGAWDRASPDGHIDLLLQDLRFFRETPNSPRTWSLDGNIGIQAVTLEGFWPSARMSGSTSISGTVVDRLGGLMVKGRLRMPTLQWSGRELRPLETDWTLVRTTAGDGYLAIGGLEAGLYDGSLSGNARIVFGPAPTTYSLSAMMQAVDLGFLLNAGAVRSVDEPPLEVHGSTDASFYLSGTIGDVATRRGGGKIVLRDGHIYRLPVLVAVLNVLNLSILEPNAAQDLAAQFFVTGNLLEIQDLMLRGQGLELVGAGTMTLPDQSVDLTLVNSSAGGWARVPVLADFVEGASRELVAVQVTGPLHHPNVRARALGGIGDEFKQLFQKRKNEPIRPSGGR